MKYVAQQTRPRSFNGVNYGVEQKVLIRKGGLILMAVPGSMYRSGYNSYYCPAHLTILDEGSRSGSLGRDILEGRVTKEKLTAIMPKLREFFGEPNLKAADIRRGKTLVLG